MLHFTSGKDYKFIIDKHNAKKAGLHYDLRIENDDNEAYSFATRHPLDFENTNRSSKRLLIIQPIHSIGWLADKDLYIDNGYGTGHVKTWDKGMLHINAINRNNTISFTANGKYFNGPFILIKVNFKKDAKNKNQYLLIAREPENL